MGGHPAAMQPYRTVQTTNGVLFSRQEDLVKTSIYNHHEYIPSLLSVIKS